MPDGQTFRAPLVDTDIAQPLVRVPDWRGRRRFGNRNTPPWQLNRR